jgi:hypothetical protein
MTLPLRVALCYIFVDMEEEVKAVPEATPSLVNMHISSHKIGHPQFFLINYPWEDTVDEDITLHWLVELSKFIFGNSRSLGVVVLEKKSNVEI